MKKRILSLVLCLVMLMSYAVPAANAAGNTNDVYFDNNDIVVGDNVDVSNIVIDGNTVNTVPNPSQLATETTGATTSPVLAETEPESVCKCGECESVNDHADNCMVKQYYMNLCAGTAEELYAQWEEFSADEQEFILAYLSWNYPETLNGLEALQAANAAPTGEASVAIDGATVNAVGIPEGGSMTVEGADVDKGVVNTMVSELDAESATELFTWDISVQDAAGADWQPDGAVKLELDLPDVKLNKHTKIYIIHTDDNGNVDYIPAEVTEDGKVAFETYGFSTFAGFTVDFSYAGVEFSIDGMTSILLSELFDKLEMPLDAADVVDLTFTDETLVSLEKLEGDWRLNSLKAFNTTEKLTAFMNDGKVYEITVTDAQVVAGNQTWDIWNSNVADGVNHIYYATGFPYDNGSGDTHRYMFNNTAYVSWQYYQGALETAYFNDTNQVTTVTLRPGTGAKQVIKNGQLIVDGFTQYQLDNGAKVTIQLATGNGFSTAGIKEVVIKDLDTSALFYVLNGSLTIKGRSDVPIVIEANSGSNYPSIYMINKASSLTLENVKFRNTSKGAIGLCADRMDNVSLTNCTFESTVTNSTYGGGAIFLSDVYQKTYTATPHTVSTTAHGNDYANVTKMTITNCKFNTNKTTASSDKRGYGGAIGLFGKVDDLTISGSTFTNCSAPNGGGGAISIGASTGPVSITGCTFTGCTTKYYGGAIHTWTRRIKFPSETGETVGQYTRVSWLHITNTKFQACESTSQDGGAIGIQGQVHTLEIDGTTQFIDCKANTRGGAIALGSIEADEYNTTPKGCTKAILFTSGYNNGKTNATLQPYTNSDVEHKYTTINTVKITGQLSESFDSKNPGATPTFWSVQGGVTSHQAGFLATTQFARVGSISLSRLAIKGCETLGEGSCIYLHGSDVLSFEMKQCWIQDCDFTKDTDGNYETTTLVGGTIRTIGSTGVVMTVDNCYFYNNTSLGNGGGIYYNAATDTRKDMNGNLIFPEGISATVKNCNFYKNKAIRDGGAIYCEANLKIENCLIHENTARRGGGIAQQIYNNAGRPIQDEEFTKLELDSNTKVYLNEAKEYSGGLKEEHKDYATISSDGGHGGGISIICNSTAALPLDTTMAYPVTFVLGGAHVYQNKADNDGGGIYYKTLSYDASDDRQKQVDNFVKDITIDNGAIYENVAGIKGNGGNGGGVYMESSQINDDATGTTTLKVTGGNIYKNTATGGDGGGIYLVGRKAVCTVTGGTIGGESADFANKATKVGDLGGNGGGIAIDGEAKIEMTVLTNSAAGGSITYNTADYRGGGVFVGNKSKITIEKGSIDYNTAYAGGGVAVGLWNTKTQAECSITGGSISHNTATHEGGAVCLDNNSTITVSGGVIDDNKAVDSNAGGIYSMFYSTINVSGNCTISNNKALSGNGGGIYSYYGTVNVTGGTIKLNQARDGGGIYTEEYSAGQTRKITVTGGLITENTASRKGGGICAIRTNVEVKASETDTGKITNNKALNGGGVYVEGGGNLTVTDGQITNNQANGTPTGLSTCFKENSNLMGVGGGIYIADGTDTAQSKFTLSGSNNYAIYGNTATFAADDVFANGNNTLLSVPTVANMDLAEYPLPAVGWVEDYPVNDSHYEDGLNLGSSKGVENGVNVFRYKASDAYYRILVPETNVTDLTKFAPNVANEYVCMTLGIPCALPDSVVIDYGLPVIINVRDNDIGITTATLSAVGALRPVLEDNAVDYTVGSLATGWNGTNYTCTFGKAEKSGNDIKYTPNSMAMDAEDSFSYAVQYGHTDGKNYYFYSNVTVIPATSIYYEDNFKNGTTELVTYEVYKLTTASNGNVTETKLSETWETVGTAQTGTQNQDRPGKLNTNDANQLYGYDAAYDSMTTYSMGSARKVTVNSTKTAKAKFTFKGTGFDVLSLTSNKTGSIMLTVTRKDVTPNTTEYYMVDTYYGYTYSGGKWEVSSSAADNALYQIPVMKVNDLPYGQYEVEIYVAYDKFFDHKNVGSYDFYLDAIRIYDPANDGANSETVKDAYIADGEGWPTYQELRDLLISAETFASAPIGGVTGIVFVDGKSDGVTIDQYTHYGPNNEVYLAPGEAIAFDLNRGVDTEGIAGVHIGVKSVGSKAAGFTVWKAEGNALKGQLYNNTAISTATDRYYDITDANGYTVVIVNPGTNTGMLSITNVKTTHTGEASANVLSTFTVSRPTVENALAAVFAQEETVAPTISLKYPTLSFESEINYNVFYDIDDVADVTEMGLITFDSNLADGTIADAVDVIPGATSMNDLYMVSSNGIAAKNLGDDLYFKVYAKLADGSYVYSDVASYNAVKYANSILSSANSSAKSKALVTAMLNYGAAAQNFFGYNTDSLMNANLTAEKANISDYSADMLSAVVDVDPAKAVNFANNGGFDKKYPTVSFEGAFSINYNFVLTNAVEGEMKLYYWDLDAYNSADVLSVDNAIGSKTVVLGENGEYSASYDGIAAKEIDETVFVAAVYECNGETYCSGVLAYSLGAYCVDRIANGSDAMQAFAAATAVYGYYAKAYFANT